MDTMIFVSFMGYSNKTDKLEFGNAFFADEQIGLIDDNFVVRDMEDRLEETVGLNNIVILYWRRMETKG